MLPNRSQRAGLRGAEDDGPVTGPNSEALTEADVAEIVAFCGTASPPEFAHLSYVEHQVEGRTVTLVEATKLDVGRGEEWLRTPLARMNHEGGELWTLYCFDRDSHAMRYDTWEPDFVQPTSMARILAEMEADPTEIFWG
jgi:hypothetical protein